MGNLGLLCILIRNLVDNALRYTQEGGEVKVTIYQQVNKILFQVTDNGPCISPELRSRVFERFYRIIGNKSPGSGLGLAITQEIAEQLNATIMLSEPEKGTGLVVTVTFPPYTEEKH